MQVSQICAVWFLCFLLLLWFPPHLALQGRSAHPDARGSLLGSWCLGIFSLQTANKAKPAGAAASRLRRCILPPHVWRLENKLLSHYADLDRSPLPIALSRCLELCKLEVEADGGATCCPTRLNVGSVKQVVLQFRWRCSAASPLEAGARFGVSATADILEF